MVGGVKYFSFVFYGPFFWLRSSVRTVAYFWGAFCFFAKRGEGRIKIGPLEKNYLLKFVYDCDFLSFSVRNHQIAI